MRSGLDDPEFLARVRAYAKAADQPPDLGAQPRRVRTRTILLLCSSACCVSATLLSANDDDALGFFVAALFAALATTAPALFCLITDIRIPPLRKRTSPEEAIRCYFWALGRRQWRKAHHALSPLTRDKLVEVPLADQACAPRRFGRLRTPDDIRQHWISRVGSQHGIDRRLIRLQLSWLGSEGPLRKHLVALTIRRSPSWRWLWLYMSPWTWGAVHTEARAHTRTISFEVATIKHRSQWWVVSGDLPGPTDPRFRSFGDMPTATLIDW